MPNSRRIDFNAEPLKRNRDDTRPAPEIETGARNRAGIEIQITDL
jgi:hypothetical protein